MQSTSTFNEQERIRTLEEALRGRNEIIAQARAEVERLRAALHSHCPNCCTISWHMGQLGMEE